MPESKSDALSRVRQLSCENSILQKIPDEMYREAVSYVEVINTFIKYDLRNLDKKLELISELLVVNHNQIESEDANHLLRHIYNIMYESSPEEDATKYKANSYSLTKKQIDALYYESVNLKDWLMKQKKNCPNFSQARDDIITKFMSLLHLDQVTLLELIESLYRERNPGFEYKDFGYYCELLIHDMFNLTEFEREIVVVCDDVYA